MYNENSPPANSRETLILRVKLAVQAIKDNDYYRDIWEIVRHDHSDYEKMSIEDLLAPFQGFWEALPDSKGIRRTPFHSIFVIWLKNISNPNVLNQAMVFNQK